MILARHPEGLPQNDIAEKVLLAAPTVSLTLKQMESANYITRVTSPDDNRKTIVKLTADGNLDTVNVGYSIDNGFLARDVNFELVFENIGTTTLPFGIAF